MSNIEKFRKINYSSLSKSFLVVTYNRMIDRIKEMDNLMHIISKNNNNLKKEIESLKLKKGNDTVCVEKEQWKQLV